MRTNITLYARISPWWVAQRELASYLRVTVSVCHRVYVSPCLYVTMSVYHRVCVSPCLYVTMSVCHCVCVSSCLCVTMSMCYYICVSMCLCVTMSVCRSDPVLFPCVCVPMTMCPHPSGSPHIVHLLQSKTSSISRNGIKIKSLFAYTFFSFFFFIDSHEKCNSMY